MWHSYAFVLLYIIDAAHTTHASILSRRAAVAAVAAGGFSGSTLSAKATVSSNRLISSSTQGSRLPLTIGQGTCLVRPGQAQNIVKLGLDCGYKLFDTAQKYGNEAGVGSALAGALAKGSLKRDELFVTTKVWIDNMGASKTDASVRQSAKDLGLSSIDLVLIHWPGQFKKRGDPENDALARQVRQETWASLEDLRAQGVCKNIGVSNFSERHLKELLSYASPGTVAVNQFEVHPYNDRQRLVELCKAEGIDVMSYCPLGGRGNKGQVTDMLLSDPAVLAIAKAHDCTAAQVVLRWHLQRGLTPIPKASSKAHLAENFAPIEDAFELSRDEMRQLAGLNQDRFALFDADVLA